MTGDNTPDANGWMPIASAPKDGMIIMVWADGYEWPECVYWAEYDAEDAAEIGEAGYWRFADELLDDATYDCGSEHWSHWCDIHPPVSS